MKTINNTIKWVTGCILVSLAVTSCLPKEESLGDSGQTLVKLSPGGFVVTTLNPVSSSQTTPMFEVRRDLAGPAALNKTTTAVLKFDSDTSILNRYNDDNGTYYIPFPVSLFSTSPDISENKLTVVFNPGEDVKTITITVPTIPVDFDFSQPYALIYYLGDVSGEGKKSLSADSTVIVQVLVKNKYDGVYTVTANNPMIEMVSAIIFGYYPFKYKLVTTGEHTCDVFEFDNDAPIHPILSNGNRSYYGGFCPTLSFSPTGNGTIISANNYYGPDYGSNKRNCVLDPSGINKWEAATKTINIKYIMIQKANTTLTSPWYRTFFDEKWTYSGPR
jgi:hypothetical protein